MDFLLGILTALSVAGVLALVRWSRKPWYIPLEEQQWSPETRKQLERVGWGSAKMGWILESMVEQYENQGRTKVRAGMLRREVRTKARRDGDFFMMRRD